MGCRPWETGSAVACLFHIARMKRGKAGAESGVVADIFKRLDAKSVEALAQVFDQ